MTVPVTSTTIGDMPMHLTRPLASPAARRDPLRKRPRGSYTVHATLAGCSSVRRYEKSYANLGSAIRYANANAGYGRVMTVTDARTGIIEYRATVAS